jgi:hypothetical protein
MENNVDTSQMIPPLPQMPPAKSNVGRNIVIAISAFLIVIVLIGTGYMLLSSNAKKATYTAQVYNQPTTVAKPTIIPTPSIFQVNIKDTSNSAIDQDNQAVSQNLNSLDADLNNVDQSFSDQQTNLQ